MSEISDKLIDATFKSVIPYITPWRIIFTATALSVISSGNWSINSKIVDNASLKTISTSFIEHVTTMPLWELLLTIGITAYLIPKISNFLTFSTIKLIHIPRCESAIAELVKLKSIRPSKLTRSFKSQIAELYQHEKNAKRSIQRYRLVLEISLGSTIASNYIAVKINHLSAGIPFVIGFFILLFFLSQKITLLYLTKISRFSIIRAGMQKIGSFRAVKSSI